MNKLTNIGVQLVPVVLLLCFMFCLYIGAKFYAGWCMFWALLFWVILWSENKVNNL